MMMKKHEHISRGVVFVRHRPAVGYGAVCDPRFVVKYATV